MALDELQQPNIGTPDFARGASTASRKAWAIVTTVAFGLFWVTGLYVAAAVAGGQPMQWSMPFLCAIGLALGLYARRKVEGR
jgi:hypothetical protein